MACGKGFAPNVNLKQFTQIFDEPTENSGVAFVPAGRRPTPIEIARSIALGLDPNAPPAVATEEKKVPDTEAPPAVPVDCTELDGLTDIPGSFQLSPNFTLARLTTATPAGSHKLQAQFGKTAAQLACNLQKLAINILEPLVARYGNSNIIISSCFRSETGQSQHDFGQAADVQFRDIPRTTKAYYERANEIVGTLPIAQMILEQNSSGGHWIHMSFGDLPKPIPKSVAVGTLSPTGQYVWGKLVNYG